MTDVPSSAQAADPSQIKQSKVPSKPTEEFSAIYLRKVAAELADDLDKVREAQDFKANSVPMLIHALKQGESMFSAEEKRRVVGATSQ
jgi:ribosome assembly protein 3